jgi:hypothetical protein
MLIQIKANMPALARSGKSHGCCVLVAGAERCATACWRSRCNATPKSIFWLVTGVHGSGLNYVPIISTVTNQTKGMSSNQHSLGGTLQPHQAVAELWPLCICGWRCALPQRLHLLRSKLLLEAGGKAAVVVLRAQHTAPPRLTRSAKPLASVLGADSHVSQCGLLLLLLLLVLVVLPQMPNRHNSVSKTQLLAWPALRATGSYGMPSF